jgi:hypothetical protein
MAKQSSFAGSPGAAVTPRSVPRLSERDTIRNRAAARARDAGEFLLTWSIPLLATALVFATVIIWFWWSS